MLDVHPPHEPVHGIRDFLLHLLTITVGLLIALGLEAFVEWRHHEHLKHQAEAKIRREIEDNRKDLVEMLQRVPTEQAKFKDLLAFFNARSTGAKAEIHNINVGVTVTTPQDASWQTANATGALAYMDYDQVQRFAAVYQLQKKLDAEEDRTMQPLTVLLGGLSAGDPDAISKEDAAVAARSVREVMGNVESMREMSNALGPMYDAALKAE